MCFIKEMIYTRYVPQSSSFCKISSVRHFPLSPANITSPAAASDPLSGSATKSFCNILNCPRQCHNSCSRENLAVPAHVLPGQLPDAAVTSHRLPIPTFSCFRAFPTKGCATEANCPVYTPQSSGVWREAFSRRPQLLLLEECFSWLVPHSNTT